MSSSTRACSAEAFVSTARTGGNYWGPHVIKDALDVFESQQLGFYRRYDDMKGFTNNTAFLEMTRRQMFTSRGKARMYFGTGREFFFVQTPYVLEQLHRALPAVARCFEEIIGETTAHRFHMDIECELDERNASRLDWLRSYLFSSFVPFLIRVFNEEWSVECSANDWIALNASLKGKKYSMHLFFVSRFFCESRIKSWIVAAVLKARCDAEAQTNEEFAKWYYVDAATKKSIVDWQIYSKGKRNFRIIGSCKPKAFEAMAGMNNLNVSGNIHYNNLRPLLPDPPESARRPWTDFLATVSLTEQSVPFPYPTDAQKELIRRLVIDGSRNFSGLCVILNIFAPKKSVLSNSRQDSAAIHAYDEAGRNRMNAFHHLFDCVNATDLSKLAWIKTRFLRFIELLHPGNSLTEMDTRKEEGVLMRYRLPVFVEGAYRVDGRRQRLCFLSYQDYKKAKAGDDDVQDRPCVSGDHMVSVTLMSDLSVTYYCFCCRNTKTIVSSPVVRDVLVLDPIGVEIPFYFEQGFVDYDDQTHDEMLQAPGLEDINEDSGRRAKRYMKDIEPLPGLAYHHDLNQKRTIVLHGGMGVGKSTVIKKFLTRVQNNVSDLYNREARIICVCFRTMLAQSSAKSFDLEYYKSDEMPTNLYNVDRIAVQLDSLHRIIGEDALQWEIKAYDVVIIDESESVLGHMSSSTLGDKRRGVFTLFRTLTEKAITVIAADADVGIRTRYFLQETRKRRCANNEGFEIPNALYARNRYVSNEIEYVDYMSFTTWIEKLFHLLVIEQKHIFLCSNGKNKLHMVIAYIMKRAEQRYQYLMDKREYTSECIKLNELLHDTERVILLDADIDGKQKMEMAKDCNEKWKKAYILGITPVVGAGLSFDVEHFHQAFVFGCKESATPRALLQLLGRVRNLHENKVHIYLDVLSDLQENYTIADAQQRISCRVQRSLDYDDLGMTEDVTDDASGLTLTRFIKPDPDRLLAHIIALNLQETTQGRQKFRSELIKVLSENNPQLYYRFYFENPNCFHRDTAKFAELEQNKEIKKRKRVDLLIEQNSLDRDQLQMAKRRDSRGVLVSDDPEIQKNAKMLIESNEIRHTFGFAANLPPEIASKIYNFFGDPDRLEKLKLMAMLLFAEPSSLRGTNRAHEEFAVTNIDLDGQRSTTENIISFAREIDFLDERKAKLVQRIMYYAGFNLREPFPATEKPFTAHTSESVKRLLEPGASDYLTEHWGEIQDFLEIKKKPLAPDLGVKEMRLLCRSLAKTIFEQAFGAKIGKNHLCSRGHNSVSGSRNKCQEWGMSVEDTRMYSILIECYLRNQGARWATCAIDNFKRFVVTPTCSILDLAAPYSDDPAPPADPPTAATDPSTATTATTAANSDSDGESEEGEEEEQGSEDEDEDGNQKKKKKKKKFRGKFTDFESMWDKIQTEDVFSDKRLETDPFGCFSFFTNTTIQKRWHQNLRKAIESMDAKRARLLEQNNWEHRNIDQQFSSSTTSSSQSLAMIDLGDWEANSSTSLSSMINENNLV